MKTKISTIILTKDENPDDLKSCIESIQPYVNEVILIDSSINSSAEIVSIKSETEYYKKKIGDKNINGFNDLRNFGHSVAKNDWCLHIDVDEIITKTLFDDINYILEGKIETIKKSSAYSFPRINLPFYENYPDYQTRLVNKLYCEWISSVHEKIEIFRETDKRKQHDFESLDSYPIIHKAKEKHIKHDINKRWEHINKKRNILICSLFKDCERYVDNFLSDLLKLTNYSINHLNHQVDLCFIEGDSTDSTPTKLIEWLNPLTDKINYIFKRLNLPDINRFEKLAILRNMLIKFGLKNYHDYVLMIDSDTIFTPDLLEQLISSIETNQCDVIAPMPFIHNFKQYRNEYFYDTLAFINNNDLNFNHVFPYNNELITKNIIKMTSVGTCYLAKSEVYNINDFKDFSIMKCYQESVNKPLIAYDSTDDNSVKSISEQVSFFKTLKKYGYQVYVDTNIKILHVNLENLGLTWH